MLGLREIEAVGLLTSILRVENAGRSVSTATATEIKHQLSLRSVSCCCCCCCCCCWGVFAAASAAAVRPPCIYALCLFCCCCLCIQIYLQVAVHNGKEAAETWLRRFLEGQETLPAELLRRMQQQQQPQQQQQQQQQQLTGPALHPRLQQQQQQRVRSGAVGVVNT